MFILITKVLLQNNILKNYEYLVEYPFIFNFKGQNTF